MGTRDMTVCPDFVYIDHISCQGFIDAFRAKFFDREFANTRL